MRWATSAASSKRLRGAIRERVARMQLSVLVTHYDSPQRRSIHRSCGEARRVYRTGKAARS